MKLSGTALVQFLTGVSVVALAATSPTWAAGTTLTGPSGSVSITTAADFIVLDSGFSASGDVTNSATIGAVAPASQGWYVDPAVTIGGNLINDAAGAIYAVADSASSVSATGLAVDGSDVASIVNDGLIDVQAAVAGLDASVAAYGIFHAQSDSGAGSALVSLTGAGDITVSADAIASDVTNATAYISAAAILQYARDAADASASLTSAGSIIVDALAEAAATSSDALASAYITAIFQYAAGDSTDLSRASADALNTGSITADATGNATAATATGHARASGAYQLLENAELISAQFSNQGSILIDANARGLATSSALAIASAYGVGQNLKANGSSDSSATASYVNNGTVIASVNAQSTGASARATSDASGSYQNALAAQTAFVSFANDNAVSAVARASAIGTTSGAEAGAIAVAARQTASGNAATGSSAANALVNTSSISARAESEGQGTGGGAATVRASAVGAVQNSGGAEVLSAAFQNDGSVLVDADATVEAGSLGNASAEAIGLRQTLAAPAMGGTATASIENGSSIAVDATAQASGSAAAGAAAIVVEASGNLLADVSNLGAISAQARGVADGSAVAISTGLAVDVTGVLSGIVVNAGSISATATGNGSPASESATAVGVVVTAAELSGTISNTGAIRATASGANSYAMGIEVSGAGSSAGTGIVENDGGSIEATFDSGGGLQLGDAVNIQYAGNPIELQLKGSSTDGRITGNIEVSSDDTIEVSDGNTYLIGSINRDGVHEGSLNIRAGGALWLEHGNNVLAGGSIVTVDSFSQEADGTLAIGVADDGTSSQINANTVTLDGSMVVSMAAGNYGNELLYEDVVISGSVIDTTWDATSVTNALLSVEVLYNPNDIDLVIRRVSFDDVAGLSNNQDRLASAIEAAYLDPENTEPFNALTAELFGLDTDQYQAALDDLSGIEHAVAGQQVMRSFRNMDAALAGVQGRDCESGSGSYSTSQVQGANVITPVADLDVVDCSGGSLWVRGQGLWANASNTSESPGFDETEWSIYGGADYTMSTGTTIGMMVGYVNADIDFDGGSDAGFDGYQVGVYGQQNWEAFYLQGLVAYGNMDVDVHRDIVVGDIAGTSRSNYDDAVWYLNGEMGYSWGLGLDWDATPYAGLSYANLNGDGFNESGLDGADLSGSVDGESLVSALGVRLSADWGNTTNYWRPELSLAWEHEFGDFTTLDAAFIGAPASGYAVTGGDYGRDAAVVEAGFAYGFEGMEFKLNYAGRWTADYDDQAVYGQFTAKF